MAWNNIGFVNKFVESLIEKFYRKNNNSCDNKLINYVLSVAIHDLLASFDQFFDAILPKIIGAELKEAQPVFEDFIVVYIYIAFEKERKRWQSVGAKSGEYGGYWITSHSNSWSAVLTIFAMWSHALSYTRRLILQAQFCRKDH